MPNTTRSKRYLELRDKDFTHLWHPFTQASQWCEDEEPLIIERGEGVELIDVDGRRYLDGVSSLWCNVHGHAEPTITQAIHEQADKISHSTFLGATHDAAIELSAQIIELTPKGLSRVFFADSGTSAVEAGLRMAVEWWSHQPGQEAKKKTRLGSLTSAYHGDTLGAIGVGYVEDFHRNLNSVVVPALRAFPPHVFRFHQGMSETEANIAAEESVLKLFKERGHEMAAFIIEPLVQGAAGIWLHSPEFLRTVARQCRKFDVLLITDEVATGFGKTGSLFAVEQAGVEPDILIMGKGLSGGYLPISAAVTSERIFEGFVGAPDELKTFFYGQTFCGNPLAAAAALANLELIKANALLESLPPRIEHFSCELQEKISVLSHVDEVRQCGLMVGIELTRSAGAREAYSPNEAIGVQIARRARSLGAFIRPLGNAMILMPALIMPEQRLSELVEITAEAISDVCGD